MELMTVILLVVLVVFVVYIAYPLKDRVLPVRRLGSLPGPRAYPLIGNLLELMVPRNRLVEKYMHLFRNYKELFVFWAGPIPLVILGSPEYVQVVLGSSKCLEKAFFYNFLIPWLGTGLGTAKGQKWHIHRKMITPTFHFKILENYLEVFSEKSEILVKQLQKEIGSQRFDIYPYIYRCALDIICATAMGTDINSQTQDTHLDYMKAVHSVQEAIMERFFHPWFYPDFIYYKTASGKRFKELLNILHGFNSSVIRQRRELYRQSHCLEENKDDQDIGKKTRKVFLDLLLEGSENGVTLNDEELLEEVETFMFGGHDTTTTLMSWIMQVLGTNQDVQDKVCEELEAIFQGSDRPPTMTDLKEMKYLERVIKEVMRLHPVAPIIGRKVTEDVEIGGYTIPAGASVVIPIIYLHQMSEHYSNPTTFDPDNFLPDRVVQRHPYSYIPFSAGPRNCIGQKFGLLETKTMLAYILRHYRVRAVHQELPAVADLTMRPEKGVPITISQRIKDSSA